MDILFDCDCGKRLRAREELAGRHTRCPSCGALLTIPARPDPGAEPEEAPAGAPDPTTRRESGLHSYGEPERDATYGLLDELDDPHGAGVPESPPAPAATGPATWHAAAGRTAAPSRPRGEHPAPTAPGTSPREYLYLVLALALIPLGFSLLSRGGESVPDRLKRTMDKAGPEVVARVEQVFKSNEGAGLDDLLTALPGGRLDEDAHLPRRTIQHWVYGALAAVAFWAFIACLFPAEKKTSTHLLLVGLFTGTLGILLLLGFQFLAGATQGVWLRGRGVLVILFYIAKFIGYSYASANDPDSNFLLSFLGFTFGVGLCEEVSKALPLLVHFRSDPRLGWRGACAWGLASGVGFGVSEGIMYSANYYNGISPAGIYVVRFISCVVLHAMWSASVGITLWRRQDLIQGDRDWAEYGLALLRILAVPMTLHGLYDTLLKKDMDAYALLVGLVSFAWFVWQVESARGASPEATRKGYAAA